MAVVSRIQGKPSSTDTETIKWILSNHATTLSEQTTTARFVGRRGFAQKINPDKTRTVQPAISAPVIIIYSIRASHFHRPYHGHLLSYAHALFGGPRR